MQTCRESAALWRNVAQVCKKPFDNAKHESSAWKMKSDDTQLELTAKDEQYNTLIAALESRVSSAEGRLTAAHEQAEFAQGEASEWKRKYTTAVDEVKKALERAALAQERTVKEAQDRGDALRAAFSDELVEKVYYLCFSFLTAIVIPCILCCYCVLGRGSQELNFEV